MATLETETIESSRVEDSEVTMTASARISPGSIAPERRLFSVEEYYKLAEVGILKRQERVELIEGEIIVKSPTGESHYGSVSFLSECLTLLLQAQALVVAQGPVRLNERTEPEPDIAVLKRRDDFYSSGLPGPSDVYFLIEVMDSSADYDRNIKLGLYARSGIPEIWLVNLKRELIEIHRHPMGDLYKDKRIVSRGENLSPEAFPDALLEVNAILGGIEQG